MSWYRSGTIAVTNGSTAVVGTSTAFIANVAIGEGLLAPDGKVYEITAVTSDTGLTLGSAYLGSNSSGQTYAIIPSQSYVRDLATQAATLVNSYQSVKDNAGSGKFGDGTVGSPGIQFTSDSDTGIRRTGANAIALVTSGADRVTLDANGTLAVTNSSSANAVTITQTGTGNAFVVEDSASTDSTPFVIDANGRTVVGGGVAYNTSSVTGKIQVNTTSVFDGGFCGYSWDNTSSAQVSSFNKARGGVIGTHAIVQSGDAIGDLRFAGSDGTQFIEAASIRVSVDGTPGTNDMPGRLVFSTTADGASSPTERMRIDSAGSVGIGTALPQVSLYNTRNITGNVTAYGFYEQATVQSDVTTAAFGFRSNLSTAASAFTLGAHYAFFAGQGTIGAGSVITNQFGFSASSGLVGATNNYGFTSNIPAGTNRYNFYAAGTADNYFAGAVGIGATPGATSKLYVGASTTSTSSDEYGSYVYNLASNTSGAVHKYGMYGIAYADTGYGGSGSVVGVMGVSKQNAAVSVSNSLFGLQSQLISSFAGTIGSAAGLYITHAHTTSAVTNVYGVQIPSFAGSSTTSAYGVQVGDITGATNAFGFHSAVANAANHYNFYASGSAPNYFNGSVQSDAQIHAHGATAIPAGGTAGAGFRLSSTANFGVFFGSGAPTLSAAKGSLYLRSDGSTTNDRMYVNTNGSTTWTAVTTAA